MKTGFLHVHDLRCCTDFELKLLVEQASAASYILEQRELIAAMIQDHGAALDKLLAEKRELEDRIGMYEAGLADLRSALECLPGQGLIEAATDLVARYKAMASALQECCQRHRLGLGGESVTALVVEEIDRLKSAEDIRSHVAALVGRQAIAPTRCAELTYEPSTTEVR